MIIAGAGPVGSGAARLAAGKGVDVLVIERHRDIGYPARCAEALGLDLLSPYIKPSDRWINSRISCSAIHGIAQHSVSVPRAEPTVCVAWRIFDREPAQRAAQTGENPDDSPKKPYDYRFTSTFVLPIIIN